jgi:Mg-chelatase subunit ChlI
MQGVIVS